MGLLGTDDVSRTPEDLIAKVKALKEEGISAYALCGAYGVPSPAITGSIKKDIAFIDEILGLKLAVSDHRAPNISTEELIRLASGCADCRHDQRKVRLCGASYGGMEKRC